MNNKLFGIILCEAIVGAGLLFWYKSGLSSDSSWVSGIVLAVMLILISVLIIITFFAGLLSPKYNFKFWAIVIVCFVLFLITLPYSIQFFDRLFPSLHKQSTEER